MIRTAEMADAPAMKHIAAQAYDKYVDQLDQPPLPLLHDYDEVARAGNTYVLTIRQQVVGMVTFLSYPDHLLLRNLAVLPAYQRQGLGRMLVDFVEAEARRRNLTEVRLWTREEMSDNIRYYQDLGYSLTKKAVVDGCGRVYFCKTLQNANGDAGHRVLSEPIAPSRRQTKPQRAAKNAGEGQSKARQRG